MIIKRQKNFFWGIGKGLKTALNVKGLGANLTAGQRFKEGAKAVGKAALVTGGTTLAVGGAAAGVAGKVGHDVLTGNVGNNDY